MSPSVLAVTSLIVRDASGQVVNQIFDFRDDPGKNAVHQIPHIYDLPSTVREAMARDAAKEPND